MLGFSNDFGIRFYRTDGMGPRISLNILNLPEFKSRPAVLCYSHVIENWRIEEVSLVARTLILNHTPMNLFEIYRLLDLNRTERLCINWGTNDDRGWLYNADSLQSHWRINPFFLYITNVGRMKMCSVTKIDIHWKVKSQENISVSRILFIDRYRE